MEVMVCFMIDLKSYLGKGISISKEWIYEDIIGSKGSRRGELSFENLNKKGLNHHIINQAINEKKSRDKKTNGHCDFMWFQVKRHTSTT